MGQKNRNARVVPRSKNVGRKKWKKGHSSSSNPETKIFREAAKSRFFNKQSGPSSLTEGALAKHNEGQVDGDAILSDDESDRQTAGGKTFNTWATNWTDCTNVTFNKVHRYWASNSALHKEILAILAAVTEVIKSQGGTETETEYFAALMTALETTEGLDSLTAITYLLNIVLKRVPPTVLRSRFSEVARQLLDVMATHVDGESTSLLKSLIMSLATLLRVQEPAVWSNSSTHRIYSGLLTFTTHKKPKVRKAAHQGVCIILRGSLFMTQGDPPPHHPAASITAKFCIQKVEECGGSGDATDTLHTLSLLKEVVGLLPQHSTKSVCETILRLMTLSNPMVTASSMQTLHGLFSSNPKISNFSSELNGQIITALYDYQPSENDVQPMQAWLVVMEKAHINLVKLDEKLGISHLPRLFSTGMANLLSDKEEVTATAAKTMKSLLKTCLGTVSDGLVGVVRSAPDGSPTPIHKLVRAVDTGLSYQFHASWGHVLNIFSIFFEVFGKQCPQLFKKSLPSIASLRDSPRFAYKAELDHTFGCAVKYMGPRQVLQVVPLNITGENDDYSFPTSWMIPVIRDNLYKTELGFFTSYFLPLAAKFRQRALEGNDGDSVVVKKSYEALHLQIWSMLPGFCTKPTDLTQSFKTIAKVLGTAISDWPGLRMEVMSSLRKLINQSKEDESSKKAVSQFAKNFLPILFNLFTADPEKDKDPTRLAVLETVKCYLQVADSQLVLSFCDKCMGKLEEENITSFRRQALLDLVIGMVSYIDNTRLRLMLDFCKTNLQNTDRSLQKKCYRYMEEVCACQCDTTRQFIQDNLAEVQEVLLSSLSTSSPSSKAPRLRCLINIFQQLGDAEQDFLLAVVPEAILCTKELAERARTAAYGLLVEMGKAQIRWADNSDATHQAAVHTYFRTLMAGLAGSPQMISATLLALTRVLYEFKDHIDGLMLESIIDNACLLLTSRAREVVKSTLSFIKVLLSAYQDTTLAPHLKKLMSNLVSMKEDARHHFRFKSKEIYAKLIRKFGYETICGMAPASIHKILINIRKTEERAKKARKAGKAKEDSDSDEEGHLRSQPETVEELLQDTDSEMEEDTDNKKKKKGEKKSSKGDKGAWLQEGNEDEIMDFLDTTASKKVVATKPLAKKQVTKSKDAGFKKAADGRLIITEGSEDGGAGGQISDEDDLDELLEAMEKGSGATKRAKKRKIEDIASEAGGSVVSSRYKAGGHGIHRPMSGDAKTKTNKPIGGEYKSKKAGGDMKKKDKPEPYAYVPLDFQSLNKRKKAKMQGRFNNLVKGARKGAMKGSKGKGSKGKK
ncbi:RRP12-like protein [Mizuhopecten yessoensis]|uniref:RRP12-like protein n=1 Tax=Mizuhopecten yessoensis TaxID=6573 RepID=A0A210PHM9_MIZYE|nr:RRP12-like protein [Mizuhopecten yessoensis]OWF35995.1 RRP12-like protein [Mizuhopecten yessoensis]